MGRFFNFLSLTVLIGGLVAAVFLVQLSQELRERAAPPEDKVKLCHKTESEENPWQQIEVAQPAIPAHLEHGDTVGDCPEPPSEEESGPSDTEETTEPTAEPTADPTEQPGPTAQPTVSPTQTPDNSGTGGPGDLSDSGGAPSFGDTSQSSSNDSPFGSSSSPPPFAGSDTSSGPPFSDSPLTTGSFKFTIGFQGAGNTGGNKKVDVVFGRNGNEIHRFDDVVLTNDGAGIYGGELQAVQTGLYDVVIKGEGYLARKFAGINVGTGVNTWNWSGTKLRAGDFNDDNNVDITDLAAILSLYDSLSVPVTDATAIYDIDGNGTIQLTDIVQVIGNYTSLVVEGEVL